MRIIRTFIYNAKKKKITTTQAYTLKTEDLYSMNCRAAGKVLPSLTIDFYGLRGIETNEMLPIKNIEQYKRIRGKKKKQIK